MPRPSMAVRIAGVFLLAGCASQVPPAGGPPDTTPPEIVSSVPAEGELHFRGGKMVIRFSEYVDRRSFQESAYLSPSAGPLTFEWSGEEVAIIPRDTLRGETTFILSVGTDLKDTRNNRMANSYTLAFSTGGMIDSCAVSGRVYDESPGGVMVYAYAVAGDGPDTLNPATSTPDYLTQTGADGSFRLTHLKAGRYRVIAVRDVFKNLLYNVQSDQYGMPPGDVRLLPPAGEAGGLTFRLTAEDTLRPYLSSARALSREVVAVRFNEKPSSFGEGRAISVTDTAGGPALRVVDFSPMDTAGREYLLVTDPQDTGAVYRLTLGEIQDPAGNRADSTGRTLTFTAGTDADSGGPVVNCSIARDSATGISPRTRLSFTFTRAVDTAGFAKGFSLTRDGAGPVQGSLVWDGAMLAEFVQPALPLPGGWYHVRVAPGAVRGVRGKSVPDSGLSRHFRITEEKFLGSIGGRVEPPAGEENRPAASAFVVTARELSAPRGSEAVVAAAGDGTFLIDALPEGRYVVSSFLDENGNRILDEGKPFPVRYAERFTVYPDTIRIRPGWPVGGVLLEFGK